MNKIYRAGLIPFVTYGDEIQFMFMRPSDPRYGGYEYQIAKGKVEDGETFEQAAIREATEELGLVPGNVSSVIPLGEFLGRTSVYIAQIIDKTDFVEPHFETADTRWMTLAEYKRSGRLLHLPILIEASNMIRYLTMR